MRVAQKENFNWVSSIPITTTATGILTFRDDEELEREIPISPKLLKAIEESRQQSEFIQHFSKFEYLWEEHSVKLKFIDLSCSKNLIGTPDFSALVKLSSSSKPLSQSCLYDESNSELAFTILYRYLQGLLSCKTNYETCTKRKEDVPITEFQIIVRGIPSWLTHQSVRNSISMELPFCGAVNGWDSLYMHCEESIWLFYLSRDDWFATVGNGESNVEEFNQKNTQCLIESFDGDDDDDDGGDDNDD
ncbi:hypothetical protein CMV_004193 [Castanea mollissima]|uniref:Uncharacterized protein n=1 Tax=Castanea mollissima TaxID=60419 RepID=A0A8J4VVI8_9ROSI|nr:hypothetical protein CMV_004193 [Castanea mollissima]